MKKILVYILCLALGLCTVGYAEKDYDVFSITLSDFSIYVNDKPLSINSTGEALIALDSQNNLAWAEASILLEGDVIATYYAEFDGETARLAEKGATDCVVAQDADIMVATIVKNITAALRFESNVTTMPQAIDNVNRLLTIPDRLEDRLRQVTTEFGSLSRINDQSCSFRFDGNTVTARGVVSWTSTDPVEKPFDLSDRTEIKYDFSKLLKHNMVAAIKGAALQWVEKAPAESVYELLKLTLNGFWDGVK